jgi:head-tail adaptor
MAGMRRPHNRSGRQRWGISFQQPVTATDPATNRPLTTWPDFGEPCDAEIEELAGGKRVLAGQPQAEQRYQVTCRWQPGIRPAMRIVWPMDDLHRILNIESAYDVKGLHQQLEIVAAEIFPEE